MRASSVNITNRELLEVHVRAYVPTKEEPKPKPKKLQTLRLGPPSKWTLVFDTETTVDATQRLRFGTYQIRKGSDLREAGIFIEPEALSPAEISIIEAYASSHHVQCMTRAGFVEGVFFGSAYDFRATIVGFNLPFDISRLAISHASARGRTMKGGFTFRMSPHNWRPRVQVKHLSQRMSLIQFTQASKTFENRAEHKRKIKYQTRRGSFIDVKTLAAAITSQSHSLASLAGFLNTEHQKLGTDEHGARVSEEYLTYAMQDVQVTWECFIALKRRYEEHGLKGTPVNRILSEASIGKAYLKEMGIKPWRAVQPEFPPELLGTIMSTYYGGRSEVHLRRAISRVLYCDFLSMYPTVCTLMGLWQFVIASGIDWNDATDETRELLDRLTLDDLQQPEVWPLLTTLVQVLPASDILPVRAKYGHSGASTIGLNYLTSPVPVWYTLADCIASKLLSERSPTILKAWRFTSKEPQEDLTPVSISGNIAYRIDPYRDDFYCRTIDLRSATKQRLKTVAPAERSELDTVQQALKIVANATSYGIFVELNVEELDNHESFTCYGPSGIGFPIEAAKQEVPGPYFHPIIATLITGAARLMLAITERLALDAGLDWVFCDTDSMAIAKPEGMAEKDFLRHAGEVRNWFAALNPYEFKEPLLKIEDANYRICDGQCRDKIEPLYCFAVSSKRYALFNIDEIGSPLLRKASAHGLGHFIAPYGGDKAPKSIPSPSVPLHEMGVERWQYDLWYLIVQAALDGGAGHPDLSRMPGLDAPAASRYRATTPKLLRWFKAFNNGKPLADQVKPFNFMLSYQANRHEQPHAICEMPAVKRRGRKPCVKLIRPVAPFNRDPVEGAALCFDRETGKPVLTQMLKFYRSALAQYHLHPEDKFSGSDYADSGPTNRRHIEATSVRHIGKEANHWEEQFYLGLSEVSEVNYGSQPKEENSRLEQLQLAARILGVGKAAMTIGISRQHLSAVLTRRRSCTVSFQLAAISSLNRILCHCFRLGYKLP